MHHYPLAFVEFVPVADLALVAAAVLSLLMLMTLFIIAEYIGSLFGKLPWPLSLAGGVAKTVARWARNSMTWVFDHTMHALEWSFHSVVRFCEWLLDGIRLALRDLESAARFTLTHRIPWLRVYLTRMIARLTRAVEARFRQMHLHFTRAIASLAEATGDRFRQMRLHFTRAIASLAEATGDRFRQMRLHFTRMIVHDVAVIDHTIAVLRATLTARIAQVRAELLADLGSAVRGLLRLIQTRFTEAKAYADAVGRATFRKAVQTVDTEAHTAAADVWPTVTAMIGQLEQTIGGDFPDVGKMLQQIPTSVPADLTGALAAAMRFIPPATRLMTDCVVPDCRDLGPTRAALHDMQLPITAAALIAWFVLMVTEPQVWADVTLPVVNPLVDAELGVLTGLLGV